jgi:hypothetical protein
MAKVLDADELAKKYQRWRPRVVSIVNSAAQENRLTAKAKKEAMDKLIGEVERAGEDVAAFRKAMLFLDHVDDAIAVRDELAGDATATQLTMFDRQLLAGGQGLGLFDGKTVKEIERNAKAAAETLAEDAAPATAPDEEEEGEGEPEERGLKVVN